MKINRLILIAFLLPGGCMYEKVVSYNPPLANLPGAVTGIKPVTKHRANGPGAIGTEIVIEHEDGTVELISRNALQMLTHVRRLIAAQGKDEIEQAETLFTEQILSERTRQEFIDRGYDPVEAYRELRRREHDVMALLARMPMGEFTPGLFLKPIGRNVFRLEVPPRAAGDLKWRFVDIVVERGRWKLRWFGP